MLLLVILLFKMAAKQSAEVLASVPKCKKAEMCFIRKICVLDVSFRHNILATSSVLMNQQCVQNQVSLNRNTDKTKLCADQLMKML